MKCLIIGGGEVALRKMELLLDTGCNVTVISPSIQGGMRSAVDSKRVQWIEREFREGDCIGHQLVIAATGAREINRKVFEEASSLCIPVNVVDDPDLCTAIFPAVWRQGSLEISVSTEGSAPFMAAAVRDRIAVQGSQLSRWVEAASKFRAAVRREVSGWNEKQLLYRRFTESICDGDPPDPPEGNKLGDWLEWLNRLKGQDEQ